MGRHKAFHQLFLDFGTAEHFHLLHGGHTDHVAVCTKSPAWSQKVYPHDDALAVAVNLADDDALDVYQSQNGFESSRRAVDAVSSLTSCWVDLDVYNVPELRNVTEDELLDKVLEAHPWLPMPTAVISSGRGFYFQWVFNEPITREKLPKWQQLMDVLTDVLLPFGADSHAKDAARVLRIIGSINQKNGEEVCGYQRTGERIKFNRFYRLMMAEGLALVVDRNTQHQAHQADQPAPKRLNSEKLKAQYLRTYQLALDRMADCHTLAGLRGSPYLAEHRSRLSFVYAVSGAMYWADISQAKNEIDAFADRHFLEPHKYGHKLHPTVLNYMDQAQAGIPLLWQGQKRDRRYYLKNITVVEMLEITLEEQQHLRTLISPVEKNRRKEKRRRDAGMVPREEYLQAAAEKREKVLELARTGLSMKEVAGCLSLSLSTVREALASSL